MTTNIELHHDVRKDGRQLIQIRISHKSKRYRVSSEIYVKKNEFKKGAKFGHWIVGHLDRDRLNIALKNKIAQVEAIYQGGGDVSPKAAVMADSFFKFAEGFAAKYNNYEQQGTFDHYTVILGKLKEYAGPGLKFSDITVKFIRDYSAYLKTKGNKVNTIGFNLKKIRAIIRQAVNEDLVSWGKNPFNKIKIETERTGKEKLTAEELDLIRNVPLRETEYKYHARSVFLFCINCMGMRVGSALKIKCNQIQDGSLHYQMNKGGKTKNIQLTDEAMRIVNFYKSEGEYLFPYLNDCDDVYKKVKSSTILINKALKSIGETAKIKKHITTHVARHTLTKMAIDAGIDMRTLQGMLNHSSVKTTENYAGDIADITGNEALKKIFKN